jgi:acetyltransferase
MRCRKNPYHFVISWVWWLGDFWNAEKLLTEYPPVVIAPCGHGELCVIQPNDRPMQPNLAHLVCHHVLRDGTRVLTRPLMPQDAALFPDFAAAVTVADSRLRFFAPLSELSDQRIAELTQLDYERAMAFIALEEMTGKMCGVVRLHLDADRQGGEYAVIVRSVLKGHGLGRLLMRRMIEHARATGLKRVHGQVLSDNTAMLRMCAELGFRITDAVSANVKMVTLTLDEHAALS